jgi:hypothetical protein
MGISTKRTQGDKRYEMRNFSGEADVNEASSFVGGDDDGLHQTYLVFMQKFVLLP